MNNNAVMNNAAYTDNAVADNAAIDNVAADNAAAAQLEIAFSLPRSLGTAVKRNRLKRRMREILKSIHNTSPLPDGAYLFKPEKNSIDITYEELKHALIQLLVKGACINQNLFPEKAENSPVKGEFPNANPKRSRRFQGSK